MAASASSSLCLYYCLSPACSQPSRHTIPLKPKSDHVTGSPKPSNASYFIPWKSQKCSQRTTRPSMSQPGAISVPTPPPTALPHSPSSHPAPPRPQYPQKESLSLSRVWLFATPRTVAYQAPPCMSFSRQEYWSALPFPSPEDLPDPQGLNRVSHMAGRCFTV